MKRFFASLLMIFMVVAMSVVSISAQETEEEDDADIPRISRGKIEKRTYMRLRAEHIEKLRGLDKDNRDKQKDSRIRAIEQLNRQEREKKQKLNGSKSAPASNDSETPATSADATMAATETTSLTAAAVTGSWTPIGPAPISNGQTYSVVNSVSGRVTSIAINPSNPNVVYVGTALGGVYRSLNAGGSWTPITDSALSMAIGAIAIDPSNPSRIYVGTGEGNNGQRNYFGVGVYRIDNAESEEPTRTLTRLYLDGAGNDVFSGRAVTKILVAANNPDVIFVSTASAVGGVGSDVAFSVTQTPPSPYRGIYRSSNATTASPTFTKLDTVAINSGNVAVPDMVFDPADATNNTIIYSLYGTAEQGIYRMSNAQGASSYQKLLAVSTTAASRINLAANTDGSILLATSEESSGSLRKSLNGGSTWTLMSAANGFCGGQCWYDSPVAIDSANNIYIGGNADGTASGILKKSTNGGSTFTKVQAGLHADSHAIAFDPTNPNTVYTGNDGGIFKSTTGGTGTWQSLNGGLNGGSPINSMQYMSVAVHPTDAKFTIGGTQDNGTHRIRTDGSWTRTDYGDGGFALIDQSSTGTTTVRQYHTYWNAVGAGGLVAFGTTTSPTAFENWSAYGCGGVTNGLSCNDTAVLFYAPMALGPGTPNTLYFGTDRLYRTANPTGRMSVVSQKPLVSGVAISAIGIAPQNDGIRIVGLEDGKVFRTTTASTTLTNVTPNNNTKYVARAVIDPNNQNVAYVAVGGFYGTDNGQHVYKTTNLSATTPTWTVAGVGIPDVPVNGFVIHKATGYLYAGTDIGVYRSTNGGASWEAYSTGLPRVAVFDMAIAPGGVLRIATHGRGMWEIQL
ncbi:MAG TPA: hypothetical protein VGB73_08700 [Pyrinomonadaceae bacterium]